MEGRTQYTYEVLTREQLVNDAMSAGRDRRRDEAGRPHGRRHRHREHRERTPPHHHQSDSDDATRRKEGRAEGRAEVSYPLNGTDEEGVTAQQRPPLP